MWLCAFCRHAAIAYHGMGLAWGPRQWASHHRSCTVPCCAKCYPRLPSDIPVKDSTPLPGFGKEVQKSSPPISSTDILFTFFLFESRVQQVWACSKCHPPVRGQVGNGPKCLNVVLKKVRSVRIFKNVWVWMGRRPTLMLRCARRNEVGWLIF